MTTEQFRKHRAEYMREWRRKNRKHAREYIAEYMRRWRQDEKDMIEKYENGEIDEETYERIKETGKAD